METLEDVSEMEDEEGECSDGAEEAIRGGDDIL